MTRYNYGMCTSTDTEYFLYLKREKLIVVFTAADKTTCIYTRDVSKLVHIYPNSQKIKRLTHENSPECNQEHILQM